MSTHIAIHILKDGHAFKFKRTDLGGPGNLFFKTTDRLRLFMTHLRSLICNIKQ